MLKNNLIKLNINKEIQNIALPKGRNTVFKSTSKHVIIDFAHNDAAMNNILASYKEKYKDIWVLFGCGGERDRPKRSRMYKTAQIYASKIFFTSDNSRNEDFVSIKKMHCHQISQIALALSRIEKKQLKALFYLFQKIYPFNSWQRS